MSAGVCFTDIDEAGVAAAGLGVTAKSLDIIDERRANQIADGIVADAGRLDILGNNAGVAARAPSASYERQQWERIPSVNLTGSFLVVQAAARVMLPRRAG